jgi:hypothetical protein
MERVALGCPRARWFQEVFGASGETLTALSAWDLPNQPVHTASELVEGLRATWQTIETTLAVWVPTDMTYVYEGIHEGKPYKIIRGWVTWHVIEHDIHQGGELFFSLGIHGLPGPEM